MERDEYLKGTLDVTITIAVRLQRSSVCILCLIADSTYIFIRFFSMQMFIVVQNVSVLFSSCVTSSSSTFLALDQGRINM